MTNDEVPKYPGNDKTRMTKSPVILGFLMFLTPVVYTPDAAKGLARYVVDWNPLTYLVCSARDVVLYGRLYNPGMYFLWAGIAVFLFLISWRLFYVL